MSKSSSKNTHSGHEIAGDVLNDEAQLSLDEFCENCGLTTESITAYIQEGLIEVGDHNPQNWRFSYIALTRIRKASRLERDLHLNPAGAALALELLDEIEKLKSRLKRYEER